MTKIVRTYLLIFLAGIVLVPFSLKSQELHQDLQGVWRAEVVSVTEEEMREIPGTETSILVQTLEAQILEGERKGEIISLENDYSPLKKGDKFFLNYLITIDGSEFFSVRDFDRRFILFFSLSFLVWQ